MQFFSYFLTETQKSCCHSPTSPTAYLAGLGDSAHVRAPSTSRLSVAGVKGFGDLAIGTAKHQVE